MNSIIQKFLKMAVADRSLTGSAKVFAAGLALSADESGWVNAGQRQLSESCGLTRPTIIRVSRELSQSGYVSIKIDASGRSEYLLASEPPKRKAPKEPGYIPKRPFSLEGIIKCSSCKEWIDAEKCESVDTAVMDAALVAEIDLPEVPTNI